MTLLNHLRNIPFRCHLILSFALRCVFIVYGEFQDRNAEVPFTDIDYKVVTDGARHVLNERSPFERHTYRYTPLLAYLMTLNVLVHSSIGKLIFSACDLLIAIVIRQIIIDENRQTYECSAVALLKKNKRLTEKASSATVAARFRMQPKHEQNATFWSLFWLYNPMAIVIATRGNGDSITGLLTLATIYALQKSRDTFNSRTALHILLAGILHGLAIHFRMFPLVFSLAYYLYLSDATTNGLHQRKSLSHAIFQPNRWQLLLTVTTVLTLAILTSLFYWKYGYQFLYEAYLYHLTRKDIRHNFSLYFYMNLLNNEPILIEKVLTFLPQLLILLVINFSFGLHRKTLSFCVLLQTLVVVAFNPVVTSQYFVWYLAILPACLKNLRTMGVKRAISYGGLWCSVQGIWLYSAYLLEFKGWNTFGFIWMQGAIFFAVNCFIMKVLIVHFDVIADV